MLKTFSLYALALLLSISILGPSFLVLLENDADIELVKDFEEESKKENKVEVDEKEKFLEDFTIIAIAAALEEKVASHFYFDPSYGHIQEVHSPPPELTV